MASDLLSPRTSSSQRTTSSALGYFDFDPSQHSNTVAIKTAMSASTVRRLDAFHVRASHEFDLPDNTSIYARRALPALPPVKTSPSAATVEKCLSSVPLRSPVNFARPRPQSQNRTGTADYYERPQPTVPTSAPVSGHQRIPSIESVASSAKAPCNYEIEPAPLRRPRQMRSISFRNFLNRNTFPPSSSTTEPLRSASSMSHASDFSCTDSCHDSVCEDLGYSLSKSTTPTTSAASSRRPSTYSLASLRSRKASQETAAPSLPRPTLRKHSSSITSSTGPSRRWNLFGSISDKTNAEDDETTTASPVTPVTELSCVRCYYFSARNCNGWIMGGSHGEACDTCTMHGFFGPP